jgi:DNA repair protein RecO (recombination protein O)
MRITLEPAFVLHHRPYRETSLLLDLITPQHGRISAVARGVRQSRSQLKPLLQPFIPLLISFSGKSELMTLISAESHGQTARLDRKSLLPGFYLNELLMKLLPKYDPHPAVYTLYRDTLLELANISTQLKTLRLFEKNLLQELGYGLQLEQTADNKTFQADKFYHYHPEHGFMLRHDNATNSTLFSGASLIALACEELEDARVLRDVKRLMRRAFANLLGQQPLHSRLLYSPVRAAQKEEAEKE